MPYVIQTNHLTKSVGNKEIVKDISLHVKKGEIYGFLGPNGAGKTSVMKMITNLWKPTGGNVELFGEVLTPKSYGVLKRMGSIIEFPVFYGHMTGRENLKIHCEYMGYYAPRAVEDALEMLELTADADRPVKNYSLDPAGMKQIRSLLKNLCAEYGVTIMISSHILSEIESIADTVGIIAKGRMIEEISMAAVEEMNLAYIELGITDVKRAAFVLSEKCGLNNFKIMEGGKIRIYDKKAVPGEVSRTLALNDVEVTEIGKKAENLEDYFLKLTKTENGKSVGGK